MTRSPKHPRILREWSHDAAGGAFYLLTVFDNETVSVSLGEHAHSSGSGTCTWLQFLNRTLNDAVRHGFGSDVLEEARAHVAQMHDAATPGGYY